MKNLVIAVLIALITVGTTWENGANVSESVESGTLRLEMTFTEVAEEGYFFEETSIDFDSNVFVNAELIVEAGITDLKAGDKVIGVFDSEGSELFAVESIVK